MTAAIDITPEQRKTLLEFLRRYISGIAVWAYGSRVKWTARPNSDLDLVAFTKPEQRELVSELKEALNESNLPFLVDLHVWDDIPERFHEIIRKEYVVLQNMEEKPKAEVIAGEWRELPLGEVITLQRGFDLPSQKRKPGRVPIVSSSGVSDYHSEVGVKGPGVVTGRYGTIGQVFLIKEDYWPLNTTLWVKDFHGNDPHFASYLLRTIDFRSCSDKSSVPGVNRNDLHRIPVLLPPLAEQKAIAAVLGALDDKIELNRRMNATLEAMARALFQNWFVDFDPVRAKLDGRKPIGLDEATAAFFPATFQESPLGHIPESWQTGSILRQADLLSGGTPKTDVPAYWNGDVPWASAKDVSQCGEAFLVSTERTVTKLGVDESSTKIIPEFATVVVSRGATTGRLTMFGHSMAMNQTCYGLRSKVGAPFALYCNARQFIERLVQGGHGSIFDTITTSTFEATDVLLAPTELLLAFDEQVTPLFQQVLSNLHQSRTLANLRDTLLPKLLSGELSVAATDKEFLSVQNTTKGG